MADPLDPPAPSRTGVEVAPPPGRTPEPADPQSVSEFVQFLEYVDRAAPYVKMKRTAVWSLVEDASTGLSDHGLWTGLRPDEFEEVRISDSDARALQDHDRAAKRDGVEGAEEQVPRTVVLWDGGVRARLGEIGVSRYEWEKLAPEARSTIKDYLRAEADVAQAVIAAALIASEAAAHEIQRKARQFLKDVTADIEGRSGATSSPLRALQRDRAWHEAQPLLAELTKVLKGIAEEAKSHNLLDEPGWLAEQSAAVNTFLTTFPGRRYFAYCTPEMLAFLKSKGYLKIAREIAHFFHRDASLDDLSRSHPPRQRPSSSADTPPAES